MFHPVVGHDDLILGAVQVDGDMVETGLYPAFALHQRGGVTLEGVNRDGQVVRRESQLLLKVVRVTGEVVAPLVVVGHHMGDIIAGEEVLKQVPVFSEPAGRIFVFDGAHGEPVVVIGHHFATGQHRQVGDVAAAVGVHAAPGERDAGALGDLFPDVVG